jgi:hypothetical protein
MLKDLIDVQKYTEHLASAFPELETEIVLGSGGVADGELKNMANELDLPPIYRACASSWKLYGISLGYFALWPSFGRKGDLLTALREANKNSGGADAAAASNGMVIVAREEANWICIGGANSNNPDVVFYMSRMSSPERKFTEIANSFDRFMVIAANLHEIAYSETMNVAGGIEAIFNCCTAFGCNESQTEFWKGKASELLS